MFFVCFLKALKGIVMGIKGILLSFLNIFFFKGCDLLLKCVGIWKLSLFSFMSVMC